MKCLIFSAQSAYARFRKPYTTTSALSFSTIHPIAVKGLIGAIMGVEYEELHKYTKDMQIAIQVINPIYKDMQSFNLIAQSNNNRAANFQSRVEFLRDVKYRMFVIDKEEKLEEIKARLEDHEYIFTPYLGCSEHIAKLVYEDYVEVEKSSEKYSDTIVPIEILDIDSVEDDTIYMDRIPTNNNQDRVYTEYMQIAFSNKRQRVTELTQKLYKVGDYNVIFL
ncbi:MAG: type I-B CRISPR-associated protein Cas5b [Lutisporaceae bacterium]